MRVLVTGASGYLGGELVRQSLAAGHEVFATYHTRPGESADASWHALDVRSRGDVGSLLRRLGPSVVLNSAFVQDDWATTADGAAHVAVAAAEVDARLVQVSTDAVFSGTATRYGEDAVPDPVTAYGAAKAAAETAVKAIVPTAVVARTSLIVGDGMSVHEEFVRTLTTGRSRGVLFTDVVRCPVHVGDLAAALLELAESDRCGIAHVAGADAISRYELGLLVARRSGLDPADVPAGRRSDLGTPLQLELRLDCTRTQQGLRTRLRGAREFLQP